jgi:hypothetical protein
MASNKIAGDGAEVYYPKKWEPVPCVIAGLLLLSIAECFRPEASVRLAAAVGVLILGGLSFFFFRNLLLVLAGRAWLKVSRQGVSFRYGGIASSFEWRDIKGFNAVQVQDGKLFVVGMALNDTAGLTEAEKGDKKVAAQMTLGRFDGLLLPDQYGWKPEDLASYLNAMKERYAGNAPRQDIYEK